VGFEMCLWEQSQVLHLFIELIAAPPDVMYIKCYDFERPMNPSSHFVWVKYIFFVITIILPFSDTASLSSLVICCTSLGTDRIENTAFSSSGIACVPLPRIRIYRTVTKQWLSSSVIISPTETPGTSCDMYGKSGSEIYIRSSWIKV
jgi:hypothetical protein